MEAFSCTGTRASGLKVSEARALTNRRESRPYPGVKAMYAAGRA